MMNFESFKQEIVSIIKEKIDGAKISVQSVQKNNGLILNGLTILEEDNNIAPTIYLDGFFEKYERGMDMTDIISQIMKIYEDNKPSCKFDISRFTVFDKVKSLIICCLINYERNKELLQDVPHIQFNDLAIIFKVLLNSSTSGTATILIHNSHMDMWGINTAQLFGLAIENTPRLLVFSTRTMGNVLSNLFTDNDIPDIDQEVAMYVITNSSNLNGANALLFIDIFKELADKLESDLYILPSSIHELIVIPACNPEQKAELEEMVKSVNRDMVSEDEILSDKVYFFNRRDCKLSM